MIMVAESQSHIEAEEYHCSFLLLHHGVSEACLYQCVCLAHGQAFKLAKETAAADIAKSNRVTVSAADAAEVARVLAARDDYAVLRVQPGASSAAVRRRYREMAVSLHPDKCRVSRRSAHPVTSCIASLTALWSL